MVQVRYVVDSIRFGLAAGDLADEAVGEAVDSIAERVRRRLAEEVGEPMRRVLNATGIFLHTNLGRAPLPRSVVDELPALLTAYCDLELELATGRRGDRNRSVEGLLCDLTGAEAALVVNNNAAAIVLLLAAHARGREVLLSRGELVEIGGSFRIHEIIESTGARLVEVGTTNRTRLGDFERAIGPQTALVMRVYPSNYRITGFVALPDVEALLELCRAHDLPLVVDEGSGLLAPRDEPQLAGHNSLSELVTAGVDIACGSGDKLLGGPQAGILVGRRAAIDPCRRHPLYRALRPNRATLAALAAVLRLHARGSALPIDRLWVDPGEHRARLEPIAQRIGATIVDAEGYVGGGSAPEAPIVGPALALPDDDALLERLRRGEPPVVGYQRQGRLVLDLRTVDRRDDEALVAAVEAARGDRRGFEASS